MDEFKTSTKSDEWVDTFEFFRASQELLKATWDKDSKRVAELVEKAHDRAYYTILPEVDTGKGYADLIFIPSPKHPDKPAMVIELKYDKAVEGAIAQIKRRDYPDRLEHYKGNILLVGINYDKDVPSNNPQFKHHSCVIEDA